MREGFLEVAAAECNKGISHVTLWTLCRLSALQVSSPLLRGLSELICAECLEQCLASYVTCFSFIKYLLSIYQVPISVQGAGNQELHGESYDFRELTPASRAVILSVWFTDHLHLISLSSSQSPPLWSLTQ